MKRFNLIAMCLTALLSGAVNATNPIKGVKPFSFHDAKNIAKMELRKLFDQPENGWVAGKTRLKESSPIYVEGSFDSPAYYEFAVASEGKDDGSILVNVDKTDVVIPEVMLGGKALFKQYREVTGRDDLLIVRHDAIHSLAVEKGGPNDDSAVVAVAPFDKGDPSPGIFEEDTTKWQIGSDTPKPKRNAERREANDADKDKEHEKYKDTETANMVKAKKEARMKRIRDIRKGAREKRTEELESRTEEEQQAFDFYFSRIERQLAQRAETESQAVRGSDKKGHRALYEFTNTTYLANWFGHASGHRWYLPMFYQTLRHRWEESCFYGPPGYPPTCSSIPREDPVGCTNTAIALVLAYWNSFHGYGNLFPGKLQWKEKRCCGAGSAADRVMWRLNELLGTNNKGDTPKQNIPMALRYIQERGYNGKIIPNHHNDWGSIKHEIASDRPVLYGFCTSTGEDCHQVGVVATKEYTSYANYYGSATIHVQEYGILANYGWRDQQKWITTYEYSSSGGPSFLPIAYQESYLIRVH